MDRGSEAENIVVGCCGDRWSGTLDDFINSFVRSFRKIRFKGLSAPLQLRSDVIRSGITVYRGFTPSKGQEKAVS